VRPAEVVEELPVCLVPDEVPEAGADEDFDEVTEEVGTEIVEFETPVAFKLGWALVRSVDDCWNTPPDAPEGVDETT